MCSYPFLVRLFQIEELSSSLGVLEPRHTLEVIHYMHIGALGKAIEYHGICGTSHFYLFQLSFPKVKHLYASCELQAKQQQCEPVQIDPLLLNMCNFVLV